MAWLGSLRWIFFTYSRLTHTQLPGQQWLGLDHSAGSYLPITDFYFTYQTFIFHHPTIDHILHYQPFTTHQPIPHNLLHHTYHIAHYPRSCYPCTLLSRTIVTKPSHPHQSFSCTTTKHDRRAFLTAVDDAIFTLGDHSPQPIAPRGVLPTFDQGSSSTTISLGTHRLCNDPTSPRPPHYQPDDLTGLDGSTPIACIEWNRVTFYRERHLTSRPPLPNPLGTDNLTRGQFNGYMSPATRRKVRRCVSTWMRSIMIYRAEIKRRYDPGRAYPVFVTLTLPSTQQHSDAEINRACLQPFLQRLKRDYCIENYFWRAEAQENGNLHFHILTDRYIPQRYLQLTWNMSIEALGYLTRYFISSGSLTPPTTEVHRIKDKVKDKKTGKMRSVDPVDYLLDYVMDTPTPEPIDPNNPQPQDQPKKLTGRIRHSDGTITTYTTRPITGRVWGMSDTLRDLREPRAEATLPLVQALEKAKCAGTIRRVDTEHATMYFGPVGLALSRSNLAYWHLVKQYYINVFGHLYPDQLPPEYRRTSGLISPIDLWIDLSSSSLYHRTPADSSSPAFKTAAELEAWMHKYRSPRSGVLSAA